jgi:hypothetical protein
MASGTAAAVGAHFEGLFHERTGFAVTSVAKTVMSDGAALSVADEIDMGAGGGGGAVVLRFVLIYVSLF